MDDTLSRSAPHTLPWTEAITATDAIDDDTATELAWCELVQLAAWEREERRAA